MTDKDFQELMCHLFEISLDNFLSIASYVSLKYQSLRSSQQNVASTELR